MVKVSKKFNFSPIERFLGYTSSQILIVLLCTILISLIALHIHREFYKNKLIIEKFRKITKEYMDRADI